MFPRSRYQFFLFFFIELLRASPAQGGTCNEGLDLVGYPAVSPTALLAAEARAAARLGGDRLPIYQKLRAEGFSHDDAIDVARGSIEPGNQAKLYTGFRHNFNLTHQQASQAVHLRKGWTDVYSRLLKAHVAPDDAYYAVLRKANNAPTFAPDSGSASAMGLTEPTGPELSEAPIWAERDPKFTALRSLGLSLGEAQAFLFQYGDEGVDKLVALRKAGTSIDEAKWAVQTLAPYARPSFYARALTNAGFSPKQIEALFQSMKLWTPFDVRPGSQQDGFSIAYQPSEIQDALNTVGRNVRPEEAIEAVKLGSQLPIYQRLRADGFSHSEAFDVALRSIEPGNQAKLYTGFRHNFNLTHQQASRAVQLGKGWTDVYSRLLKAHVAPDDAYYAVLRKADNAPTFAPESGSAEAMTINPLGMGPSEIPSATRNDPKFPSKLDDLTNLGLSNEEAQQFISEYGLQGVDRLLALRKAGTSLDEAKWAVQTLGPNP